MAVKVGVYAATAGTWRNRFAESRTDGLDDEPRPGAPREEGHDIPNQQRWIKTLPKGATHWSLRTRAIEIGHAPSTAIASGKPSGCSRTASRPSSSRPIRCSWRRCVRQAPVPARALHADISLMAQPSRTVLRRSQTERALKRGLFRLVADLAPPCRPETFRWTKTANDILARIQRFCLRTLAANR